MEMMSTLFIALGVALLALLGLAFAAGGLLGFAAERFRVDADPIVDRIDALLPQTQCGQCGHPGCHPYAEAIAAGEAINHCVPGGQDTIDRLAALLGVESLPLDAEYGVEAEVRKVAFIREEDCIGCTKCIQACPVDAIIGAAKHTHTVIVSECTGCDLCVEPCPVDCIDMVPLPVTRSTWHWDAPPGIGEPPIRPGFIPVRQLG
jgi:electron transport complex protein RnfB